MKKPQLNASSIRTLLIIILIIIGVFIVGGFYYAVGWLDKYAANIYTDLPPSSSTEISPKELGLLQTELYEQRVVIDKAASITASRKDYSSKIQQDINRYAGATGIKVTEFGPAKAPATQSTATPLVSGIQASYISITIQNPVAYTNLMKFIKAIETNLPKMRLTGINLGRVENPKGYVNVEPIIIEIYLR